MQISSYESKKITYNSYGTCNARAAAAQTFLFLDLLRAKNNVINSDTAVYCFGVIS